MTAPYGDYAAYVDPSLTVDLSANYWGKPIPPRLSKTSSKHPHKHKHISSFSAHLRLRRLPAEPPGPPAERWHLVCRDCYRDWGLLFGGLQSLGHHEYHPLFGL